MEYNFRELKATDLGTVCKILSAVGVKDIKNLDIPIGENVNQTEIGIAVMFGIGGLIIENMHKAQDDIDKFIASVAGMKVADVKNLSLGDYGDVIMQIIAKEEFRDFFGHVMKLFNR